MLSKRLIRWEQTRTNRLSQNVSFCDCVLQCSTFGMYSNLFIGTVAFSVSQLQQRYKSRLFG